MLCAARVTPTSACRCAVDCLSANPPYSVYADCIFAGELRETDKDHRRELLQERLRYTLEKRYFNKAQDGMTFSLGEDGNLLVLSGKPKNAEARERAIIQMFWLIYIDRFSPVSLHIR